MASITASTPAAAAAAAVAAAAAFTTASVDPVVSLRPLKCVIAGCRRKPYYPRNNANSTGGWGSNGHHATAAAPHPIYCRGHRPDGCTSPQDTPSSPKMKSRQGKNTLETSAAEHLGGAPSSGTTVSTSTTAAVPVTFPPPPPSSSTTKRADRSLSFRCRFEGCGKRASHGSGRNEPPTHCLVHRDRATMLVDHRHRLCDAEIDPPCLRQASFGWPPGTDCAPASVANTGKGNCGETGPSNMQKAAEKTAATAVPATRKRARPQRKEEQKMFCLAHRQVGMVDLRNNHCAEEGCSKRPTHAFDGQKAKFCAAHREVGMMNVVTLLCEVDGCMVTRRFGSPGQQPRFCRSHRPAGTVNVKDRRCEHELCYLQPSFSLPGEKKARFCSDHSTEGMVNVRHPRCRHRDDPGAGGKRCLVYPTFGDKGSKTPIFCFEHKKPDMVDIKRAREASKKRGKRHQPQPQNPPPATALGGRRNHGTWRSPPAGMGSRRSAGSEAGIRADISIGAEPVPPLPPPPRLLSPGIAANVSESTSGVASKKVGPPLDDRRFLRKSLGSGVMSGGFSGGADADGTSFSSGREQAAAMEATRPRRTVFRIREVPGVFSRDALHTNNRGSSHRPLVPFSQSALALLPAAMPRGSVDIDRDVEAAVAAAGAAAAAFAAVDSATVATRVKGSDAIAEVARRHLAAANSSRSGSWPQRETLKRRI